MKWLLMLVIVVAIGFFGYQYMNKNAAIEAQQAAESAAAKAAEATKEAIDTAQEAMPEGVDLTQITDAMDGIVGSASEALGSITDLDSAKAALPAMEEASSKLSGLGEVIARLPDAAKGPIGSIIESSVSVLQPLIEKASAIPGVGDVIEPIVGPMVEMMQGLAG